MKINYKLALIISLAFNLAFLGTMIYRTVDKKHQRPSKSGRGRESMQEWLELSPEQEAQIQEIRDKCLPQYKVIREQMTKAREKNTAQFMSDSADTNLVFANVDEVGRLQASLEKLVIRQMMEESKVLSTEQREKFMKRVKERMGRRSRSYRRSSENGNNRRPQDEKDPQTKKEESP